MRFFLLIFGGSRGLIQSALAVTFLAMATAAPAAETGREATVAFTRDVQPLMKQFCFGCHGGPAKKKDDPVRLDRLDPNMAAGPHAETWHDVLSHLNRGEMPPEDEPQPSAAQRQKIVDWVTAELKRAAEVRRSTGGHVVLWPVP